ncbi:MAG: class I tRNA ligase family protein, partial [Bacteroidales bacterium]
MKHRKTLIAIAWPYVNGELHIGHGAGYLIPADIEARFQRAIGNDVLMVSGSDCYGTPITVEADRRGVTPKEIADEYHAKGEQLL